MTHRPLAATLLVAGGVASAPAHADHAPVEQWGEVVIMEGDDGIVTDDGTGSLAITVSENALEPGDLTAITGRFYETYPDDFDEIVVLTTFTDAGASGSLAYEYPVQGDVAGIGSPPGFPASWDASAAWGSTTGRLHAFVDMKGVDDYAKYDGLTIDDPASLFYPVLGQEFAHRWVAYAKFRDASGAIVDGLLGRAHSHWSPLLETQGSLVDGNHWVDEGGGSFACV